MRSVHIRCRAGDIDVAGVGHNHIARGGVLDVQLRGRHCHRRRRSAEAGAGLDRDGVAGEIERAGSAQVIGYGFF